MAIKGYLASPGFDKVKTFISSNQGVRHVSLNIEGKPQQFAPQLMWDGSNGSLWTTNRIQTDNEILFKIEALSDVQNLTLHISDYDYPLVASFEIEGGNQANPTQGDIVLLYNQIMLSFAYRTTAI